MSSRWSIKGELGTWVRGWRHGDLYQHTPVAGSPVTCGCPGLPEASDSQTSALLICQTPSLLAALVRHVPPDPGERGSLVPRLWCGVDLPLTALPICPTDDILGKRRACSPSSSSECPPSENKKSRSVSPKGKECLICEGVIGAECECDRRSAILQGGDWG